MGILQDRVALVTGSSRGIGKAIARALAREGAKVALCSRNADAVRMAGDEISPGDGRALGFRADVTNAADVRNLVQAIVARWGRIHILVNNAGINARIPIASDDDAGWRAVLDSTVLGAYYVTREVLRHMPERTHPTPRAPADGSSISPRSWDGLARRATRPTAPPSTGSSASPGPWRWRSPTAASRSTPSARDGSRPTWPTAGCGRPPP